MQIMLPFFRILNWIKESERERVRWKEKEKEREREREREEKGRREKSESTSIKIWIFEPANSMKMYNRELKKHKKGKGLFLKDILE